MTSCLSSIDLLALAAAAFASVAAIVARYRRPGLYALAKPIPLFLLIALFLAQIVSTNSTVSFFTMAILAGLVAGVLGDILLLSPQRFLAGLVAFLMGHVFYILAFASRPFTLPLFWALIPFAVTLPYGVFLIAGMEASRRRKYAVPILVYLIAITCMLVTAVSFGRSAGARPPLFTIAAGMFCLSDGVLAWNRFRKPFKAAEGIILTNYYTAQILIAFGAMCLTGP